MAPNNEYSRLVAVDKSAAAADAASVTPPPASDTKSFLTAIIAFLGSGVLGFPYAFKLTGIALGSTIVCIVAALTAFCMLLLVDCKYKIQVDHGVTVTKYGEIGRIVLGNAGAWLVNSCLVISQIGFGVAYIIFIAANAHDYFGVSKELVVLACVVPLIAFCLIKHIKQLAYVALAADVLNFTGLAVVYASDFSYMKEVDAASLNLLGVAASIPYCFGVASYSFAGIGMALPLEHAMENKSHFQRILLLTVALIFLLYSSFGICGYLAFGDATQDVVTLNIEGHGRLATTVKLCLCAGLLCAFPMMLFPVYDVVQPAFLSAMNISPKADGKIALFRASLVLVAALVAGGAPSFGAFISFIGSTCCSLLGFVLPVVFHLRLFANANSPAYTRLLYAITALGSFAVLAGFYTAASSFL